MYLGHASVDTLLNTYWHTSHIHLASYTWHVSQDINISQSKIAAILKKHRPSVNRTLASLRESSKGIQTNDIELLSSEYLSKSFVQQNDALVPSSNTENSSELAAADSIGNRWVAFDRLLCHRLIENLTLNDLKSLSEKFTISTQRVDEFIRSYKEIVSSKGVDYFEPTNSELLISGPKHNSGTLRGAPEREKSLSNAFEKANKFPEFLDKLVIFSRLWLDRTNVSDPWFIARNKDELMLIHSVLTTLGAQPNQFEYSIVNFDISEFSIALRNEINSQSVKSKKRLSTGPKNLKTSEIGIRVCQMKSSNIGDYRDTHRLALILSCILHP